MNLRKWVGIGVAGVAIAVMLGWGLVRVSESRDHRWNFGDLVGGDGQVVVGEYNLIADRLFELAEKDPRNPELSDTTSTLGSVLLNSKNGGAFLMDTSRTLSNMGVPEDLMLDMNRIAVLLYSREIVSTWSENELSEEDKKEVGEAQGVLFSFAAGYLMLEPDPEKVVQAMRSISAATLRYRDVEPNFSSFRSDAMSGIAKECVEGIEFLREANLKPIETKLESVDGVTFDTVKSRGKKLVLVALDEQVNESQIEELKGLDGSEYAVVILVQGPKPRGFDEKEMPFPVIFDPTGRQLRTHGIFHTPVYGMFLEDGRLGPGGTSLSELLEWEKNG